MPQLVAPTAPPPSPSSSDPVRAAASSEMGDDAPFKFSVPFVLTSPVRVTANGAQALRLAVPVVPFHSLNLALQVFLIESPVTVSIAVETAMQNESEDDWQTVDTFTAVVSSPTTSLKVFNGLLSYVRYRVTLNGTAAISFAIQGVAHGALSGEELRLIDADLRLSTPCNGKCGHGDADDASPTERRKGAWICGLLAINAGQKCRTYHTLCPDGPGSKFSLCWWLERACLQADNAFLRCEMAMLEQ